MEGTVKKLYEINVPDYARFPKQTKDFVINPRDVVDSQEEMTQREDALKFETARIKALQEERLHIQKKTFTKWINSFLSKARMEVEELFTDLSDGKKLLKLLEIISGERLAKPNNGRMRVHKIENVNKSLAFLHTKVRLESIGAEDIVDGNPRLILGLIWTIILRFQIQEIEIDVDEENESSEKRSAKDALLLWCQRKTSGYPGVNIQDFTGSWRSGLGFNALIHAHRPDLIDLTRLSPQKHIENLNYAFDVAQNELGVPRLLDAEDVDSHRPDEKSILTYVASYYHTFARMKNEMKSGRRIANILGQVLDSEKHKSRYELLSSTLLEWIRAKIAELGNHDFPNSLEGVQSLMLAFKQYRTLEKPLKYQELSEIEILFFHINTQLKSLSQPLYVPIDGQLIQDLQKSWGELEQAEHHRENALRVELQRQERLEQLAYKFERKRVLRDGYLKEMIQVLSDPRYGSNLSQVDATVKKHEAISADILAREERFNDLTNMAEELVTENYRNSRQVVEKEQEVMKRWKELLSLLEKHKASLATLSWLMSALREIETLIGTIQELEASFMSDDVGPHLLAVEDLVQIHALSELQVNSIGEAQRKLHRQAQTFIASGHKEAPALKDRLKQLDAAYASLQEQSKLRRAKLEDARNFYQFLQDHEEEEGWIREKGRICQAEVTAKDLRAVVSLQQKHKALLGEMKARRPRSEQLSQAGRRLVDEKHPMSADIVARTQALLDLWKNLENLAANKTKKLEDAAKAYQYNTDANEAESWLKERQALVSSQDLGADETSAQALLQRHRDLEGELNAYKGDIDALNSQADTLLSAGITKLELLVAEEPSNGIDTEQPQEEWVQEIRTVPQEVWVEEEVERIEPRTIVEQRSVAQVKSLYPFTGQGMSMTKGEVMFLLDKTNNDWWHVRKVGGQDGFVPANYVQEIEPKNISVQVRRPEKVRSKQRVKKIQMVKQVVPVKKTKKPNTAARPVAPKRRGSVDENSVEKRQKKINATYDQLQEQAKKRHSQLEDAIRLYGFYRECDAFEKWMRDCEKLLTTEEPGENVEAARRKYEKFLTDLSASARRLEELDREVENFAIQGHGSLGEIKARQRQVKQQWDKLNALRAEREKSLEGASSVELFRRTCEEAKDWMVEKMQQLDSAELGPDLKTVQALQRRHGNLERELAPVQDKVQRVNLLAASVKSSYPNEKDNVNAKQKEIQSLWEKVKTKALERRTRLEDAVGQQIFINSSKNLLAWLSGVGDQLRAEEPAKDVQTAQKHLKTHLELKDDIQAHTDEFAELTQLGRGLLARPTSERAVLQDYIARLGDGLSEVQQGWADKNSRLQQSLELQQFNREADQVDANTKSHEEFLKFPQLGGNIDDVEALLRQHEDFENKMTAQEERLKNFSNTADRLIEQGHYDKQYVKTRRDQVLARRAKVRQAANERREALLASRRYQQFSGDADELRVWLDEKRRTAIDENYRDLANLERKLQKHEAFERELRSNHGRMRDLNKTGEALIGENNYRSSDVRDTLTELNGNWDELMKISADKGRKLRQAAAQHSYNRTVEDARLRMDEIQTALQSHELGADLRSCKELLKKHQVLENDISVWEGKIADLRGLGEEMAHEGHFDAENIMRASKQASARLAALKEPGARDRRRELEESLKYHKFKFELDAEKQWIQEHLSAVQTAPSVSNLYEAQSAHKKHAKLGAEVTGHKPHIRKTLDNGKLLAQQTHPEANKVGELCSEIEALWSRLESEVDKRGKTLEQTLKAQQYLFEVQEVENWLNEKQDILNSTDFGRDRDATTKLLTRHKALELQLDSYQGIITEMSRSAAAMVSAGHPDSKLIAEKQSSLSQQLQLLMKLAAARQQRLVEALCVHEYFAESAEFERYIRDNEQTANSEDYGTDYEHLLLLQARFDDFRHRIQTGAERFRQCEELARKLNASPSPHAAEIETKQAQLGEGWNRLLALIETREQKLAAAGEIHRFHRDVAEALARIQEKSAGIPEDKGKDLNSVLALMRRHEGFENDLVALEAQLQVLVEDAARLIALYPGNNAKHIADQQAVVLDSWNELQSQSIARREELGAAVDFQRFVTQARSLMGWSTGLRANLTAEEKVSDAAGAQALKGQHEAIKSEIEAREESFRSIVETGEALAQGGHSQAQDIQERLETLLEERQRLHAAWQHKKVHLDQLIDLHFFLRDAKQLETLSTSQEVALSSTEFGSSVEEVSHAARKHDEFERVLAAQEDKFTALHEHSDKLVAQNHFDSANIAARLKAVLARRVKVKDLAADKKYKIQEALLYTQYMRDVAEAEVWIAEKQKALETQASLSQVPDLETKIKRLQKHQAFQSELRQHQARINTITDTANTLITRKHKHCREVKGQLERLLSQWNALLQESANQGRGLEEAQDILEFNLQVDKIESWIRDKELLVSAKETGKDYEHCASLQRRLDDAGSDMKIDDARLRSMTQLADKIIAQGGTQADPVKHRKDQLIEKWKNLQGDLNEYRNQLGVALEIHALVRDISDTIERISDKSKLLGLSADTTTLQATEQLVRKQHALNRDMTAIEAKIKEHEADGRKLSQKYPEQSARVHSHLGQLQGSWSGLQKLLQEKQKELEDAFTRQKFLAELRELEGWAGEMVKNFDTDHLPKTTAEAELFLQHHQDRKAEIDGRQEVFRGLREFGTKLGTAGPEVAQIEEVRGSLNSAWESRKFRLEEARQLQRFNEMAENAEGWLAEKEAFLAYDDLGDSLASVEALLRKHEAFEKTLSAQLSKIDDLEKFALELLTNNHFDAEHVQLRVQAVTRRREKLREAAAVRKKRLLESRELQAFLRSLYEVDSWLNQKVQIAVDENYRDQSNLTSKIQRHQAFEAELAANKELIGSVSSEGEALVNKGHFASMEIQSQLCELDNKWRHLLEESELKRNRLKEAYQALLFGRTLDELQTWLEDCEAQLQSEDHGRELAGAQSLAKKHAALTQDYWSRSNDLAELRSSPQHAALLSTSHVAEPLSQRAALLANRFTALQDSMQIRKENLDDSLALHQLLRDVDEQAAWLDEKMPLASSQELGSNLDQVKSLQRKHQALEAEVVFREQLIRGLITRSITMVKGSHFASPQIEQAVADLQEKHGQLRDAASLRKLRLQDALESQMFYARANETEQWLRERLPLATSADYGKDEESVSSLSRKLEALMRDIHEHAAQVANLNKLATALVDRNHFDAENIHNRMNQIEMRFSELESHAETRERRLRSALVVQQFLRETLELEEFLNDQTQVAASEEYGNDIEHVELLIQKFESFLSNLNAEEAKISKLQDGAEKALSETVDSGDRAKVEAKLDEVLTLYRDLRELAAARQEALAGAKQVHIFDRAADETVAWVQEKTSAMYAEGYGHDLESIQALVRKHQGYERDLEALKQQVDSVNSEAGRLSELFPDAREHIDVKKEEMNDAFVELQTEAKLRNEKLQQAEKLQAYFDEYRDLMAWINEMLAKVTAPELASDVAGAELLLQRHQEHQQEMGARNEAFAHFIATGNKLIQQGHFLSSEIRERLSVLEQRRLVLADTWTRRKHIYEQNLDTQMFKRDAELLDSWLTAREPVLRDPDVGESIPEVEELIRKHEDFEKTVEAQEDKFAALKRITLLEQEFARQREAEVEAKKAEKERAEKERQESRKRMEIQKITEQRRREDEKRRVQESRQYSDQNQLHVPQRQSSLEENRSEDGQSHGAPLSKSGSFTQLFNQRRATDIKRAESMKVEKKSAARRVPSFTTRRRTQSFRRTAGGETQDIPPVEIRGVLDRKHVHMSGGKRAAVRSWKTYYTVLCGQLLCFFKDLDDFVNSKAATSPIIIYKANCVKAEDYTKRKHVFRLKGSDDSEFLFLAATQSEMEDWVNKINFHAKLPPNLQLLSYEESAHKGGEGRRLSDDSQQGSVNTTGDVSSSDESELELRQHLPVPTLRQPPSEKPPVPPRGPSTQLRSSGDWQQQQQRTSYRDAPEPMPRQVAPPSHPPPQFNEAHEHWPPREQAAYGNVAPRPISTPAYISPPNQSGSRTSVPDFGGQASYPAENGESSSKKTEKKQNVLSSLFRKKKATHL